MKATRPVAHVIPMVNLECSHKAEIHLSNSQHSGTQRGAEINSLNNTASPSDIVGNMVEEESEQRLEEQHTRMHFTLLVCIAICLSLFVFITAFYVVPLICDMLSKEEPKTCQCILSEVPPENHNKLFVVDTYTKYECSEIGDRDCESRCTSLASSVPDIYKEKMCQKYTFAFKHLSKIYYRNCGVPWQSTDFQERLCCRLGLVFTCPTD